MADELRVLEHLDRLRVPLSVVPGLDPWGLWCASERREGLCTQVNGNDVRILDWGHRRDEVWVSMLDAASRDRGLRWGAVRFGIRLNSSAPFWGRALIYPHSPQWLVGFPSYRVPLEATAGVDPADETPLPDGSLLADALALASWLRWMSK